jgi:arsenite methyltransferase
MYNTNKTIVMKAEDLKLIVKEKYGEIALQTKQPSSCCGTSGCCGETAISMIGDEYNNIEGHFSDADLGLGCGIPTQFAGIAKGHSVLDLGSGAGNDCFVACSIVGESGKVTGLDFTVAMINKAIENNRKLGFKNVEFVKGDIEEIPLSDNSFDVVVSNCVLNLVPDKDKAFAEIMRVLRQGGHFCVSDVVIKGSLPDKLRKNAEMYAGCVSGAIVMNDYLKIIEKQGFKDVTVHKQKEIEIPIAVLTEILSEIEIADFRKENTGIFSITVSGYKN